MANDTMTVTEHRVLDDLMAEWGLDPHDESCRHSVSKTFSFRARVLTAHASELVREMGRDTRSIAARIRRALRPG